VHAAKPPLYIPPPCFIFCGFTSDAYQSLTITFLQGKNTNPELPDFWIGSIVHLLWKCWLIWQLKKRIQNQKSPLAPLC